MEHSRQEVWSSVHTYCIACALNVDLCMIMETAYSQIVAKCCTECSSERNGIKSNFVLSFKRFFKSFTHMYDIIIHNCNFNLCRIPSISCFVILSFVVLLYCICIVFQYIRHSFKLQGQMIQSLSIFHLIISKQKMVVHHLTLTIHDLVERVPFLKKH